MENWKDVSGFPGYKVSDAGKLRSVERYVRHSEGRQRLVKGRVISTDIDKYGYLKVRLSKEGTRIKKSLHRLIAIAFIPNIDKKPTVNHIDGIKTNNRVENLEWNTYAENNQHAFDNGLKNNNHSKKPVKITKCDMTLEFDSCRLAAKHIGCDFRSVSKVVTGKGNSVYGWKAEFI